MARGRSNVVRVATVTAVLLLAGCSASPGGSPSSPQSSSGSGGSQAGTGLEVPLIAPFSGPIAAFGANAYLGLSLAFQSVNNEVNGHPLSIQKIDDQCTPAVAVTETAKILDTAMLAVGPNCSGDMLAIQSSLADAKIPDLFLGYLHDVTAKGDQYVFAVPPSDSILRQGLIKWAKDNLNITKWALLHDTSGYGAGGATTFQDAAKATGDTVTQVASYNGGEKDFTGLLLNLDKSGAQAIDLIGYDSDLGTIVKQAKQVGIKTPIVGDVDYNTKVFQDIAGTSSDGEYFIAGFLPDEKNPAVTPFVQAVQAQSGDLSGETANAYVAGLVIVDALKRIQGPITRDSMAQAIRQTNLSSTIEGTVAFDANGARTGSGLVVIGKMVDGKPTFVARQ